jgi:CNT family concentrative nucleoside transporter
MANMTGLIGIAAMIGIAFLMSENRKAIIWKPIVIASFMQIVLALLITGIPKFGIQGPFAPLFQLANAGINNILSHVDKGGEFVFGNLVRPENIGGFIFAFKVLPTIIFFSAFMGLLYHYGIMQKIVHSLSWIMYRFLKISGAESLSTAGNIFLGQTEAPLLIKPYVEKMTRSEVMCIMVGGFANVAGGVLAAYVGMLSGLIPDIAGHLLTVSVMSAPATIVFAKIIVPETNIPETANNLVLDKGSIYTNGIEAAASSAYEGTQLAITIAGMLLAFIALLSLGNACLTWIGGVIHLNSWIGQPLTLELVFGWIFAPFAWSLGVAQEHIAYAGQLLGKKVALNEFVAYLDLAQNGQSLDKRSAVIMSYALCGFANFSSIAIQIGGIGGMAPGKKSEIAALGLKAMIAGMFASAMCGAIIGLFI